MQLLLGLEQFAIVALNERSNLILGHARTVLELPPGEALVLQRGQKPRRVEVVITPVVERTPQLADAG